MVQSTAMQRVFRRIIHFFKWEQQSFNGQQLRYLNVESAVLTINMTDDNPLYNLDGRYMCTVTNGVPDSNNVTLQEDIQM